MTVFIAWSGDRSLAAARALSDFLPMIMQSVNPRMSEDSLQAGERWATALNRASDESQMAILCVTPENAKSPWLLFEAGALSHSAHALLCLLIDISPVDLPGPLSQFQFLTTSRDDILGLVKALNR